MSIVLAKATGAGDSFLSVTMSGGAVPPATFPAVVQIGTEQIVVLAASSSVFGPCLRGQNGTSRAPHAQSTALTLLFSSLQQAVPGSTGQVTSGDDVYVAKTLTAAAPATERLIRAEMTVTPATAVAVPSNGSLVGVRGAVTLTSGKSITDGFLYGTQGKAILDGATIDVGSDHIAGVYAQMSANGATFTSGHIAPLMSVGQHLPAGIADMLYMENNDVTKLHALIEAIANADYVIDATSEDGNSAFLVDAAGSSAGKYLRIKLSGTEYKIALLAAS